MQKPVATYYMHHYYYIPGEPRTHNGPHTHGGPQSTQGGPQSTQGGPQSTQGGLHTHSGLIEIVDPTTVMSTQSNILRIH